MSRQVNGRANEPVAADQSATARMPAGDRRRQLIETAIRLFSQRGFTGTTTKEIALAAGVTEAIIFRHFKSKDDLYAAILDYKACELNVKDWLDEMRLHAERRDDEKLFHAVAARMLAHHRGDRDFIRLMLYSALEGHELARSFRVNQTRPLQNFLREYIAQRQREGAFRACNPNAAVQAFIGSLIHHILATSLFAADYLRLTDKDAIENFTTLFLSGLRSARPARQRAKRQ